MEEHEISPLDYSVRIVEEKNVELLERFQRAKRSNTWSSSFTMTLKGVIDAAVNGGIKTYKDAFFTSEFQDLHPDKQPELVRLRKGLLQHLQIAEEGLAIHSYLHPPNITGLHVQLESKN